MIKLVYVLLYKTAKESEGIHSLEFAGKTIILMFENKDDAERYCGLLEAQDFPSPKVVSIEKTEIELFCEKSGYEAKFVEAGFVPKSDEERLCLVPPQQNRETSNWSNEENNENLEQIRKKLEDLL